MGSTLNQSKQNFRAIGIVSEFELTHEACEVKLENDEKVDSERIRGKISVRINNTVKIFDVFCTKTTSKNEEAKTWKNAKSWLEFVPEIGGSITTNFGKENKKSISGDKENASLVSISGRINENRYYNQNTKDAAVNVRWNANRISTSKVSEDDEHGCTLSGTFYIKSIKSEEKNEEETGRLLVTLCAVGYGASPIVVETVVAEDLAEAFNDMYEAGQTASFDIDVVSEHIGSTVNGKKAFGDSGKIKANGYDRETLMIVGGDEPIEESDEEDDDGNPIDNGWIDPKAMKAALKERDTLLAEIKANEGNGNNKKSSAKPSTFKDKKRMGAKKIESPILDDDEDDPFDEDEDF